MKYRFGAPLDSTKANPELAPARRKQAKERRDSGTAYPVDCDEIPVILVNGALSCEQIRFALCHELAHMIFPSLFQHVLPVEVREECANWFAGTLFLPIAALRDQLGGKRRSLSWSELGEIQSQFGVGSYWIARRCREAEIIFKDTYRELLDQYRRGGWSEMTGDEESSTRLRRLAVRAITEGIATPEETAALLGIEQEEFYALLGIIEARLKRRSDTGRL